MVRKTHLTIAPNTRINEHTYSLIQNNTNINQKNKTKKNTKTMQVETTTTKTITVTKDTIIALVCDKFNLKTDQVKTDIQYKQDDRFPNDQRNFEAIIITSTEIKE